MIDIIDITDTTPNINLFLRNALNIWLAVSLDYAKSYLT